ncbi:IS21-like element helper ATPase IstB [Cognatiyoonia sp. IB215182]|uniref:IS21-like element helper ATPase IstB n=1 Tax=Cognatiyoonia sp. IB215182 TaxID=3097353 RepID=UPI002A150118|nr:IS21-like element helper ATPase IstB [Cognatiyoonia sp. IB215182]MDX8355670.1 IS21-like element helper ATPase IstB [Cognatiyoonia sp. IB215182]
MSNSQILELLHELRLAGFREELEHQLQHPQYSDMPIQDRILRMLQAETERRYRNKIDRLMKAANFKYQAAPDDINYRTGRNLDKAEILSLLKSEWIDRSQNLLISGASGTGKTWLACALGVSAVQHERSVRYVRAGRLVEEMMYARLDGTITKLRTKLARLDLLIIDDFALSPMSKQELTDLFEIIEDRSARSSTIMIAQRAPEEWYDYIADPLLADAFMDRIRSRAHLLQLKGKSLR